MLSLRDTQLCLTLTEVNHDHVRHLTLMDVLTHSEVLDCVFFTFNIQLCIDQYYVPSQNIIAFLLSNLFHLLKVTAKFKCVVRVVAAVPYQGEKFCTPAGKYMIRLTLEDPTARIHAFVVDEDGVRTNSNLITFRIVGINIFLMIYYLSVN